MKRTALPLQITLVLMSTFLTAVVLISAYAVGDQSQSCLRVLLSQSQPSETTWLKIFEETTTRTSGLLDTLVAMGPSLKEMPATTKKKILKRIAEKYPMASKTGFDGFEMGPKRALDAWIRVLLPSDKIFKNALAKVKSPKGAYQEYLNAINRNIVKNMAENTNHYGVINSNDVLALAKGVQKFLQAPAVVEALKGLNLDPQKTRVLFFGGIVKGLGRDGSDLDVLMDGLPEEFYHHEFKNIGSLEGVLKKIAEKRLPNVKLNLAEDAHGFFRFDNVIPLDPFYIETTPVAINLLSIYPRNNDGFFDGNKPIDCENMIDCARYPFR